MLLGDTDVEEPVCESLAEGCQAGRPRHRGGDGHDVATFGRVGDQRIREHRRPPRRRGRGRQTGMRIDDAAGMHQFGLVVLGRRVPHPLAGHHVNDHRSVIAASVPQRVLHRVLIVAVDRADIFDTQIGEHHLRGNRILEAGFHAVHRVIAGLADHRHAAQGDPATFQ